MPKEMMATFATRRDAEMAVEHAVQEHGLERDKIQILPVSEKNSAGAKPAGGDLHSAGSGEGGPELAGRLTVNATVDEPLLSKVRSSFEAYGGSFVD